MGPGGHAAGDQGERGQVVTVGHLEGQLQHPLVVATAQQRRGEGEHHRGLRGQPGEDRQGVGRATRGAQQVGEHQAEADGHERGHAGDHSSRRRLALAVALTLAASGLVGAMGSPPVAAAPAPTSTPARVGKPTSMAALGDSITQATGTGALSQENPKNSWATGWEVNSVRARLGISTADARNLSAKGGPDGPR